MPHQIRRYCYNLDHIVKIGRLRFSNDTIAFLQYVTSEFTSYFIELIKIRKSIFSSEMIDCLYFYFSEKLRGIFAACGDFQWIAFEFDTNGLFPAGHVQGNHRRWIYK